MLHQETQSDKRAGSKVNRWWQIALVKPPQESYLPSAPMSDVPAEWTFLKTGWRLALILTGNHEGASRAFSDAVEEVRRHPNAGDLHRLEVLFFSTLRRRCLRVPAANQLQGLVSALHQLPEPGRSALALIWLDAISADDLHRVVGVEDALLADALEKSRQQIRQNQEALS